MKRILSLLLSLLVFSSAVEAFDITFDATVDYIEGGGIAGEYIITKSGVSIYIEQGVTNGIHYRIYKGHSLTICSSVGDITSIIFYCVGTDDGLYGPANFITSTGTYATSGNIGNWYGREQCVTFVAYYGQVRITKIVVTVDGDEGLHPPHITPAGGTYYSPIEVRMACATKESAIYYTLDGTAPTTSSAQYTAPFMVSETTTVKAISAKDDMVSEVVTASYDIAPGVCLSDLVAMDDNMRLVFNHEATVLYQNGHYLYLRDECDGVPGYGQVYGNTGQTYCTGDVIPPGWGGIKMTYDGHAELSGLTGFKPASRNESIQPEVITISQVGEDYWAHYVVIKDVYINKDNLLVIDQEGNSCPYYPQLTQEVDPTMPVDVVAIVTSYKGKCQLCIIAEETFPLLPPPVICCLEDLYMLNKGQVTQFECPLTAIYQNGSHLYVKDSCDEYGLIYGANAGGPFMNGDQIMGRASWTVYSEAKQLTNYGEWTKTGETAPVEPVVMPIEELTKEMVHWFVKLEKVSLAGNDYEPLIEDETGSVPIFNRFNVEIIEDNGYNGKISPDVNLDNEVNIADINCIIDRIQEVQTTPVWVDGDGTYDVIGFVSIYGDRIEIIPIKIVHHVGKYVLIGDVNGDREVNIADVNAIIDIILSH